MSAKEKRAPDPAEALALLEDMIRFCLPHIFSFFGYDSFSSWIIKVTRDAEIDIDNDISTSLIQKIEKGLKNRKKGKPVRFVFDRAIDPALLTYLVKRLNLHRKDNLIPGGRIHNFKDFINFPDSVFEQKKHRKKPFPHPALKNRPSITDVVLEKDVLLNFPYHSFDSMIERSALHTTALAATVRVLPLWSQTTSPLACMFSVRMRTTGVRRCTLPPASSMARTRLSAIAPEPPSG